MIDNHFLNDTCPWLGKWKCHSVLLVAKLIVKIFGLLMKYLQRNYIKKVDTNE